MEGLSSLRPGHITKRTCEYEISVYAAGIHLNTKRELPPSKLLHLGPKYQPNNQVSLPSSVDENCFKRLRSVSKQSREPTYYCIIPIKHYNLNEVLIALYAILHTELACECNDEDVKQLIKTHNSNAESSGS